MAKIKWTKGEEDLLRRLYPRAEIPKEEIMKVFLGRTWYSIQSHAASLGLHRGISSQIDQQQMTRLEKVYKI